MIRAEELASLIASLFPRSNCECELVPLADDLSSYILEVKAHLIHFTCSYNPNNGLFIDDAVKKESSPSLRSIAEVKEWIQENIVSR
jgi:hypothetical protein